MEELTIGERIDHYMKKYHMNNGDVAGRLGISKATLISYKNSPELMRYGTIKKLCRIFNIPVERLLEGR